MQFKATIFAALMGFAMLASLDANAAQQCINSHDGTMESRKNPRVGPNATLFGSICDIYRQPSIQAPQPTPTQKKSRWTLCINGVDLKTGRPCWLDNPGHRHGHGWHHGHRPQPITLRGPQAFEVLRNGYILSNYLAWDHWMVYTVKYYGHRQHSRIYNCRVSPNGNWAECTTQPNKWSR